MILTTKYMSEQGEKNAIGRTKILTGYAPRATVEAFIDSTVVGSLDNTQKYKLASILPKSTDNPDIWEVDLKYIQNVDQNGNPVIGSGWLFQTSTTRMQSIPIEDLGSAFFKHKYKYHWNHCLAVDGSDFASVLLTTSGKLTNLHDWAYNCIDGVSSYAYDANGSITNTYTLDEDWKGLVMWLKEECDVGSLPVDPDTGDPWTLQYPRTKPGVEVFEFTTTEITEIGKFKTQKEASKMIKNLSGYLCVPTLGTAELPNSVVNWKCEGGTVDFDGVDWVAKMTYLFSPGGWDLQMYTVPPTT